MLNLIVILSIRTVDSFPRADNVLQSFILSFIHLAPVYFTITLGILKKYRIREDYLSILLLFWSLWHLWESKTKASLKISITICYVGISYSVKANFRNFFGRKIQDDKPTLLERVFVLYGKTDDGCELMLMREDIWWRIFWKIYIEWAEEKVKIFWFTGIPCMTSPVHRMTKP